MKKNQANRGGDKRLMYIENRTTDIDGHRARIGWVTFSNSGLSIYYRGRTLARSKGQGISSNYYDADTGEEYWVSGLKRRGSNSHPNEKRIAIHVDEDARSEYESSAGT